jgi:hypothetical protein
MRASELIAALERIRAEEGSDPICCRETESGPQAVVSVLLEGPLEGNSWRPSSRGDRPPPVVVIW